MLRSPGSGVSNHLEFSQWGKTGRGATWKPPECDQVCPFDGSLLGKSIRRWSSGGCERAGFTPPWERAACRPGRLGKWAKWSDWFPEPGSESTRAGRHWWGRIEPRQRRWQNRGAGAVTVHSTSANGCRDLKLVGLPKGRSEDAGAWVKETDTVL